MDKILFTPISVGSGLVAGIIGRKLFAALWGVIDDEEAPKPEHRRVQPAKLVGALLVEGALFALILRHSLPFKPVENIAAHGLPRK